MTGVYKAEEDAQRRWRSAFDSAIIRLVLLVRRNSIVQLGWVDLIAHVFDMEVRGLFAKPVFALLPWLLGSDCLRIPGVLDWCVSDGKT